MVRKLAVLLILAAPLWAQVQNHRGTVTGATATTARSFTSAGSDDAANTGFCYWNAPTAFTVAFWFKSHDVTQTNRYALAIGSVEGTFAVIYGFVNDGSGHAQLEAFDPQASVSPRTGSQITILDTNWHHVAYRYNGTEWAYFLDGSKTVINASVTLGMSAQATSCTLILNAADPPSNYADASYARLIVTTAAMSDAQISALASTTCSSSGITSVQGYWKLLGASSPEPESSPSPNTNSLTLAGTPTQVTGPICSGS